MDFVIRFIKSDERCCRSKIHGRVRGETRDDPDPESKRCATTSFEQLGRHAQQTRKLNRRTLHRTVAYRPVRTDGPGVCTCMALFISVDSTNSTLSMYILAKSRNMKTKLSYAQVAGVSGTDAFISLAHFYEFLVVPFPFRLRKRKFRQCLLLYVFLC